MLNFKRTNSDVFYPSEVDINDNKKVKQSSLMPSAKKNIKKIKKNMLIIVPISIGGTLLLTGVPVIAALATTASTTIIGSIFESKLQNNKSKKDSKRKSKLFQEEQIDCLKSKLISQKLQYDYEIKTYEVGMFEADVNRKESELKWKELEYKSKLIELENEVKIKALEIKSKQLDRNLEQLKNNTLSKLDPNINVFYNKFASVANSLETRVNISYKSTIVSIV